MRPLALVLVAACASSAPPPQSRLQPPPPAPPDPDPLVDADLQPPAPELARDAGHLLAVPPVPAFELPPQNAAGWLSVQALRVHADQLLDQELTVAGVITWVYTLLDLKR